LTFEEFIVIEKDLNHLMDMSGEEADAATVFLGPFLQNCIIIIAENTLGDKVFQTVHFIFVITNGTSTSHILVKVVIATPGFVYS
jgi:hypothetical protein